MDLVFFEILTFGSRFILQSRIVLCLKYLEGWEILAPQKGVFSQQSKVESYIEVTTLD